ncbi:hypothetical protein QAD02_014683 [Eretmocerus hayati]|uniref:Uncharacterized protein n=1 Tax=Eretmocerus hayati TaxID=131215 RepID=A0ACC2P7P5_9HYME|nr:hypothetical protein QAD02_014683 [Eretmocerus hayati]
MPLSSRPPPLSAGISSLEQLHAYAYGGTEPGHLPPLKPGSMLLKHLQPDSPGPRSADEQQQQQHQHQAQLSLLVQQSSHNASSSSLLPSLGSSVNNSLQNLARSNSELVLASTHNSTSSSPLVTASSKHNGVSQQQQQQQQQQNNNENKQGNNCCEPPLKQLSLKPKTMTVTPEVVMKLYSNKLTPYEHHEIFNYPQIYFIGANAKKRPGIIGMPNNNDYDNDKGSYIHIIHDHVIYRYEVLKVIGKGSFGQVVKAYDHKNHEHVALKMVRNEERFHRQAQEEVRILRALREQDKDNSMNVIHMFDSFTFRNHMCITFELLSINLYELIKKNKFQGFSLQLVRKFSHSLLQCLDALHKNKIIHCDMKPENVLLKQQGRSGIKVPTSLHP